MRASLLPVVLCFGVFAGTTDHRQAGPVTAPVAVYASYLGGREPDLARAVATDPAGNIYVTGTTYSRNFPVAGGYSSQCLIGPLGGCQDIFVAKFDPTGSRLVYATYLGSRSGDDGNDIAVDRDGNAIVTGSTGSDLIAAKLDPNGRMLWVVGFTAYPGAYGRAVTTDAAGNVYITGETFGRTFYTRNPLQGSAGATSCTAVGGGSFPVDAIVIKLDPNGRILFSSYLGGDGNDLGRDIAVDAAGRVYVAGSTSSRNFPIVNPIQSIYGGGEPTGTGQCTGGDAFVTRIAADGLSIEMSTYLGGSGNDTAHALAVDAAGNIFAGGATTSADFPGVAAEGAGGFLAKLRGNGRLEFAALSPRVAGLAADAAGHVYTAGEEVRRVDPWGRTVEIFPAVGGASAGVALHPSGRLLVAGEVETGRLAVAAPFQPAGAGFRDAFLAMYTRDSGRPAVLNAASYAGPGIAAGSLATFFGQNLADATATADRLPLPMELAGTRLSVTDEGGREMSAPLIFVSPTQINFVAPPVANGVAEIRVVRNGETSDSARTAIETAAPGVFTAGGSGSGWAAAIVVRISPDGTQAWTPVARCAADRCEPVPIERPASGERLVLSLFGTGIRGRDTLESLSVTLGGRAATVLAAEPHSEFAGLDQVNVELPGDLTGGRVEVVLSVDGRLANPVELLVP